MNIDILDLAQKLSGLGLTTVLILILLGGRFKYWVWGYQLIESEARNERLLAEAKAETKEWKALALRNLEMAKVLVTSTTEGKS